MHLQLMKDHGPKRSVSQILPTMCNNAQQQPLLINYFDVLNFLLLKVTVYRIHYVVGNACVKVWATKIISEFKNYLEAGERGIERRCTYLADVIAGIL